LFLAIRKALGVVFHEIARSWDAEIVEGHIMADHVHMLLSVPPKHPVSKVVGALKGKSAVYIARTFRGRKRNLLGESFGRADKQHRINNNSVVSQRLVFDVL